MIAIGIILYLSIGLLAYTYIDHIYQNMIDRDSLTDFEIKSFESKHTPSMIMITLFWPIEVTSWIILIVSFIFAHKQSN